MEGPSLLILREELEPFVGKKVLRVTGNTKQPKESLERQKLEKVDTWGKNLFLVFSGSRSKKVTLVKVHFLMFGSYRINEKRENYAPRLELKFKNGILYFYSCSIKMDVDDYYKKLDRKVDLMSPKWDIKHVLQGMEANRKTLLCDLFLDQTVFAGSGNIVKNEVLFNIRRHPRTTLTQIARKDWPAVAHAVREYCWNFYEWKKKFELRRHWQVYRKTHCPLCGSKLKLENLGKFKRRTFYCTKHERMRLQKTGLVVHPVLPAEASGSREPHLDH